MNIFYRVLGCLLILSGFAACSSDDEYHIAPNPNVEMIRIKAGTFYMGIEGSLPGEPDQEPAYTSRHPVHKVTLTKDFYMGKYPITVGEFRKFVNDTGYKTDAEKSPGSRVYIGDVQHDDTPGAYWDNPFFQQNERHPVVLISWNDAIVYCNWLSRVSNLNPVYTITISGVVVANWNANGYRLPTEAEWEYSCRAGTNTIYYSGDTISADDAWFEVNSNYRTNEAGLKPPNAFGLYDMHGNIWEWVWDWREPYPAGAVTDPVGPVSPGPPPNPGGPHHATRGGSWVNEAWRLNCAERSYGTPNYRTNLLGFRIARSYNP